MKAVKKSLYNNPRGGNGSLNWSGNRSREKCSDLWYIKAIRLEEQNQANKCR